MTTAASAWDAELYQQRHSFVYKLVADLLELLAPQPGERVLDLGCGTGQLTAAIAERGAHVVGLDRSAEMLRQARRNAPALDLVCGDARAFAFTQPFDAVFSNATLHWIPEAGEVAAVVARALRPGGRFVGEFGGKGNCELLREATRAALEARGYPFRMPWYFPSVAEYAAVLEAAGFEVRYAAMIPRLTPLEGDRPIAAWMGMFGKLLLEPVPEAERSALLDDIERRVRPHLCIDGRWYADYRRLRFAAVRTGAADER